jgi:CheY-like chemotaxis protein
MFYSAIRFEDSERGGSVTEQKTILVIDDEYGIADLLKFALEDTNYRVLTAPNGKIGLALAQNETPDLVLLDVMMPIMDGPATLRALQAHEALREIPVIMMSSINEGSVRALCDGFVGFVRKPFYLDALLNLVGKALLR